MRRKNTATYSPHISITPGSGLHHTGPQLNKPGRQFGRYTALHCTTAACCCKLLLRTTVASHILPQDITDALQITAFLTQLHEAKEDGHIQPTQVNDLRFRVAPDRLDPAQQPSRQLGSKRGWRTALNILGSNIPATGRCSVLW
jgi:hypothetical protein